MALRSHYILFLCVTHLSRQLDEYSFSFSDRIKLVLLLMFMKRKLLSALVTFFSPYLPKHYNSVFDLPIKLQISSKLVEKSISLTCAPIPILRTCMFQMYLQSETNPYTCNKNLYCYIILFFCFLITLTYDFPICRPQLLFSGLPV